MCIFLDNLKYENKLITFSFNQLGSFTTRESKAKPESKSREKEEGSEEGAKPLPEIFFLNRTFEIKDNTVRDHVQLPTFMNKLILNYSM